MTARRSARAALALCLAAALSGCLGTIVEAPGASGSSYGSTRAHIIGSSTRIDASSCKNGLKEVATFVPLWGVAVGILTIGIIVPMETVFTCAK
jgi:hypothetical protein